MIVEKYLHVQYLHINPIFRLLSAAHIIFYYFLSSDVRRNILYRKE